MKYIYVAIFLLLINNNILNAKELTSQYQIDAGILREDAKSDYVVEKETRDVPLIYKSEDPNYYFGFTLREKNGKPFICQIIMEMPTPQTITDRSSEGYMKEQNRANVGERTIWTSEKAKKDGYLYGAFRFSAGDKEGLYRVKILINDKQERTIDFNVKRNVNTQKSSSSN